MRKILTETSLAQVLLLDEGPSQRRHGLPEYSYGCGVPTHMLDCGRHDGSMAFAEQPKKQERPETAATAPAVQCGLGYAPEHDLHQQRVDQYQQDQRRGRGTSGEH